MGEISRDGSPQLSDKETREKSPVAAPLSDFLEEKRRERVKKLVETLSREGRQKDATVPEAISFGRLLTVVVAVIVAAGLMSALVTLVSMLRARIAAKITRPQYCRTPGCSKHAGLFYSLNESLDPCTDFGMHVCSSWRPVRFFGKGHSVQLDVTVQWLENVGELLQNGTLKSNATKWASNMFKACMADDEESMKGNRDSLASFLKMVKLHVQPDEGLHPLEILVSLAVSWRIHLWFRLTVLGATKERNRRILIEPRAQHGVTLSTEVLSDRRVWEGYLSAIFGSGNFSQDDFKVDSDVNDILSLSSHEPREPKLFALGSIGAFTRSWNATVWMNALDGSIAQGQERFTQEDGVIVSDVFLLRKISNLTERYDRIKILRHLTRWLLLSQPEFLYDAVLKDIFARRSDADKIGRLLCQQSTEQALEIPILFEVLRNISQKDVNELLESTLVAAKKAFDTTPWIDVDSRTLAKMKLTYIDVKWPHDKILNPIQADRIYNGTRPEPRYFIEYVIASKLAMIDIASLERVGRPSGSLLSTTAYYHLFNSASVATKALAGPFYYPDSSHAIRYGGLGYIFALQLAQTFDREGVLLDPVGRFTPWWTPKYRKTYQSRERCGGGGNSGSSTFPEVPAMEIAFRAFKANRDPLKPRGLDLRGHYTADQVFFMTLCRTSCRQVDDLKSSESCNKAVKNSVEFAQAFSCPVGSMMNPIAKCPFFGNAGDGSSNREL